MLLTDLETFLLNIILYITLYGALQQHSEHDEDMMKPFRDVVHITS